MILSFTLSMPGRASWNGRWIGQEKSYVVVRNLGNSKKSIEKGKRLADYGYFVYDFGDRWRASIEVKEVSSKEAIGLRRKSIGFCGYDWMVQSILDNNCIVK